jgi:type IV pilus assembly protein PilY1
VGDYKYTVALAANPFPNTFSIAFNDPTLIKLYPNQNYPGSNPVYTFPATWVPSTGTLANAYQTVDETTANTTDYITNKAAVTTTDQALFDYDHANAGLIAASGTISSITIHAYAKKNGASTLKLQGVLWLAISGPDMVQPSGSVALTTSFADIPFDYPLNPTTGLPWQWSDFTSTAGLNRLKAFGVQAIGSTSLSTSFYPTVSQVYIQINVSSPLAGGPYNDIVDQGTTTAKGILDTMSSNVRFGLAQYNGDESGHISDYVDYGAITGMIGTISSMTGGGNTPLAETLYEIAQYYRQDSSFYFNTDYIKGCNGATTGTSTCAASSTPNSKDPYFFDFNDPTLTDKYVPCAKSFVILMTDGEPTQDQNIPGTSTSAPYSACTDTNIKACSGRLCDSKTGTCTTVNPRYGGTLVGKTFTNSGTDYMIDVAFWEHTNDMRPGTETDVPTTWRQSLPGKQTVTLYPVFLFGSGSTFLKDAAIYGGFNDLNDNNIPDCITTPAECYRDTNNDGIISGTVGVCSNNASTSCTVDANCTPGTCVFDDPITYYEGDDGYQLETNITNAIFDILRRVSSGTAASVLASGEGSGANLVQATYYPQRRFFDTSISWIGGLQNLWYFVDPHFASSNILEDTDQDLVLDLNDDKRAKFFFDTTDQKAKANLYTGSSTTTTLTLDSTVEFEQLKNIWEAGKLLWNRSASDRTLYTSLSSTSTTMTSFVDTNYAAIRPLLNTDKADTSAVNNQLAKNIINFVRGMDISNYVYSSASTTITETYRSRTAAIDLNGNDNATDTGVIVSHVAMDESAKVWKLGDIISSTPRIASWVQLNNYDKAYNDSTYGSGSLTSLGTGSTPFISTATYTTRGMVYVGSNDGMLHAFKLGTLELTWSGQDKTSMMSRLTGTELGKEKWAFIPRNVLPYLQYLKDQNYCHISSVDLTPVLVDASINIPASCSETTDYWKCTKTVDSWKTILIGGMRLGGACRKQGTACNLPGSNCVNTPMLDPADNTKGLGYSSYFALDVTDENNPKLLWEFSDPALGFSTSGPAVVKINARAVTSTASKADVSKNGRWFVVFGSGPTGPIDPSLQMFMGRSDQNLKLFVLDLKTGVAANVIDTGIAKAFSGSLSNAAQDSDLDYQDNAVYIPYVTLASGSTTTWNDGGVLRLLTNQQLNGTDVTATGNTALNPSNWRLGTVTPVPSAGIPGIGPVTSSIARLQNTTKGELWLYFGTGRYYYKTAGGADDANTQRSLFGIKDPCFQNVPFTNDTGVTIQGKFSDACLDSSSGNDPLPIGIGSLTNVTTTMTATITSSGWFINLDPPGDFTYDGITRHYDAERCITNPLSTTQGNVFFTTFKPSSDICSIGGKSFIWAVTGSTGGAPSAMLGTALIQVSTGSIEQKKLESAFTDAGGRKTGAMEGVPPTDQGLSLITQPPGVRRILHMREK